MAVKINSHILKKQILILQDFKYVKSTLINSEEYSALCKTNPVSLTETQTVVAFASYGMSNALQYLHTDKLFKSLTLQ